MSAQIRISTVGVPSEKNTGISLDVVTSAAPAQPKIDKLNVATSAAMSTNNMPEGRKP